jgi:hypothetical protein
MKNSCYSLFIGLIILVGCQAKKDIQQYVVKIKPIGNSDVPRVIFYISLKKIHFIKKELFVDEILTDENSLRNIVSFIEENDPYKNSPKKEFTGFGSLEFSIYNSNSLLTEYELNREQSRLFLISMLKNLSDKNSDIKLINSLRKDGLDAVNY